MDNWLPEKNMEKVLLKFGNQMSQWPNVPGKLGLILHRLKDQSDGDINRDRGA